MLAKRIIPCLDVDKGRVVKGVNFVNLRDAGDPVAVAGRYEAEGADELVFLDITASHERRDILLDVVRSTAEQVFMPLTVGGGIRSIEDCRRLLNAGADKISVNSAAVRDPEFITAASERFGSQCIVVAIDPKRLASGGRESWDVHVHGGRVPTGLEPVAWAQEVERRGAGEILLTVMSADGTGAGYDIEMTRAVAEAVHIPVIASGGAPTFKGGTRGPRRMVRRGVFGASPGRRSGRAWGPCCFLCVLCVLCGSCSFRAGAAGIFHFGTYSIAQTKRYLAERGVPVREVPGCVAVGETGRQTP